MPPRDVPLEELADQVQKLLATARRKTRRQRRRILGFVRVFAGLAAAGFVVPIVVVAGGILLGAGFLKILAATPLAVLLTWGVILFAWWSRTSPRAAQQVGPPPADLGSLPAHTERWIEQERGALPREAERRLDAIARRLVSLAPQLRALEGQGGVAIEARRLIGDELPALVSSYQKVPRALRGRPLHGGESPESRLINGLAVIEEAVERLEERVAADDLRRFATHERYLELKYTREELE